MIKRIRVQPAWLLIIYPTWFMWPTLSFHSSNLIKPSTYSDLNGLYNSALFLHGMKFPWSKVANLNGMVGESFWSLATYSQSIHYVLIWLLTRLLPYVIAVNCCKNISINPEFSKLISHPIPFCSKGETPFAIPCIGIFVNPVNGGWNPATSFGY